MKITICSSAFFAEEAYNIKQKLEEKGHEVFVYPQEIEINGKTVSVTVFYKMRKDNLTEDLLKVKTKLVNEHIRKIESSDAILVLNFDKNGKEGYIGGNTFLEIGIAYYLNKKIFLWKKPYEGLPYFEEIMTLDPIIIDGDLEKIK